MSNKFKITLCLSGGGFRATLFHLGVLKRLHELGLLAHVSILSAVSGGAVTAALFHRHVYFRKSYEEIIAENRDDILDLLEKDRYQFEKDNQPLSYDWPSFEAQLLKATRNGILGHYLRSSCILISLILALIASIIYYFASNWAVEKNIPQAIILAVFIATTFYLSLLPETLKYARQRYFGAKNILDRHGDSFYTTRLPFIINAFGLPFLPGRMRIISLDNLFDSTICGDLNESLKLLLGAVELNRGREMVFSNTVLAELGPQGSIDLWEERSYQDREGLSGVTSYTTFNINYLPLAEAVAASSAFPPFFAPIVIRRGIHGHRLIGVFSDAGVIDNAALNAPIEMMIYCSQNHPRYANNVHHVTGKQIGPASFEEEISDIFIVNAGAPASQLRKRRRWPKLRLLLRIIDIMQGYQDVNVIQKLELIDNKTIGPKFTACQIDMSEFPWEDGSNDTTISFYLARIRTHFDAFDPIETATLVYSGYCQANIAFGDKAEASKPLRNFRDIAREVTGADRVGKMSKNEIIFHLSFSHIRWGLKRNIWRGLMHCFW